jgi:hypothetical protein
LKISWLLDRVVVDVLTERRAAAVAVWGCRSCLVGVLSMGPPQV